MSTREYAVASAIQSVAVRLTNAEVKALPTTAIELVPDPGAGRLIVPVHATIRTTATAGAYTNVDAGCAFSLLRGGIALDSTAVSLVAGAGALADQAAVGGALSLNADNAAAGAFTGGNAANSMLVTVFYSIVTVS